MVEEVDSQRTQVANIPSKYKCITQVWKFHPIVEEIQQTLENAEQQTNAYEIAGKSLKDAHQMFEVHSQQSEEGLKVN